MTFRETSKLAERHLIQSDPVLGAIVLQVGRCRLKLHRNRFGMLTRSILFQQISGFAARAIHDRLLAMMPDGAFTAAGLAALSDADFRRAGVSAQKAGYLRSLAELTRSKQVKLTGLAALSDEQIVAELVQIKGVGEWTAQMFLIFALGRPDVLPHSDLGVRQAMRALYELDELPDKAACERLAQPWRPYASIASWYCWRSLELGKGGEYVI